jgi:hypothetical protein
MVKKKKKLDLSNPEYEKVRCGWRNFSVMYHSWWRLH